MNEVNFRSEFFQLIEVSDGVFAAIVKAGRGAMGNAGVIDMGDFTIVFDTFFTPTAARDLRTFAEDRFMRPVKLVINSHFHSDHVNGNQEFNGASIVSTTKTRDELVQRGSRFLDYVKATPDYLTQFEELVQSEQDEALRREMHTTFGDMVAFVATVNSTSIVLPHVTCDGELTFTGTKRTAKLICPGGGHTLSDAYLYLPDDEVIFMGDLLAVQNHVQFKDGDAASWIGILEDVEKLPMNAAIPGHGPVGAIDDVHKLKRYLIEVVERATSLHESHKQDTRLRDGIESFDVPPQYEAWAARSLYNRNIHQLLTSLAGAIK